MRSESVASSSSACGDEAAAIALVVSAHRRDWYISCSRLVFTAHTRDCHAHGLQPIKGRQGVARDVDHQVPARRDDDAGIVGDQVECPEDAVHGVHGTEQDHRPSGGCMFDQLADDRVPHDVHAHWVPARYTVLVCQEALGFEEFFGDDTKTGTGVHAS